MTDTYTVPGVTAFRWTDRAKPVVELGIGDSRVQTPNVARWDLDDWNAPTSTWTGTDPVWVPVTELTHRVEFVLGRRRATDAFEEGRLTLTISNVSGWADPTYDVDPDQLSLRAGRSVRVAIDHTVIGEVVKFRGYIDTIVPKYDAELSDVVEVTAVCALGEAGRATLAKLAAAVGANELAGTRINRILDAQKWPTALRAIEQTGVPTLATTLGKQTADLLGQVVDSVGGAAYGDEAGRLVFRGRHWQTFDIDDPLTGVIGNLETVVERGALVFPTPAVEGNYASLPLSFPAGFGAIWRAECVRPPIPVTVNARVTTLPFQIDFTPTGVVVSERLAGGSVISTPVVTYATLESHGFPLVGEVVQFIALQPFFGKLTWGWRIGEAGDLRDDDVEGWNGEASVVDGGLYPDHTSSSWTIGGNAANPFAGKVHRVVLECFGLQVDVNADTDLRGIAPDAASFIATTGQTVTIVREYDPLELVPGDSGLYTLEDPTILNAVAGKPGLYVEA